MKKALFTCLFSLFALLIFGQNKPNDCIILTSKTELALIGKQIYFLEDSANNLTISEIESSENQNKFQKYNKEVFTKPSTHSAFWIKIVLQNQSTEDLWLETGGGFSCWYIDFYSPDSIGNYAKPLQTGSMRPTESRAYPNNFYWLPLAKAQEKNIKTYYLKMQSGRNVEYPFQVGTLFALHKNQRKSDFLTAGFVGLMLIMVFYNLFLYFIIRERIYLIYVFTIIASLLNATSSNNYSIFDDYPWFESHSYVYINTLNVSLAFFAYEYLKLKEYPKLYYTFIVIIFFYSFVIPLLNLLGMEIIVLTRFNQPVTILLTFLSISSGLYVWKKGRTEARYFVLAWFFVFVSTLTYVLVNRGVFPYHILTRNSNYFGFTMEILMFSFAIGDKFNRIRKEREKEQRLNLELIQSQNTILEQKVAERTQEIQQQNHYLVSSEEELRQNLEELNTTQEQLKISESVMRGLVESQTSFIVRTNLKGLYTYVNKKYIDIFGYIHQNSKGSIIGEYSMTSICEEDRPKVVETVKKLLKNPNQIIQVDVRKPLENGKIAHTLWDFSCILDSNNYPIEIQYVGIDYTDRKEAEEMVQKQNQELQENLSTVDILRQKTEESKKEVEKLLQDVTASINYALRIQNAIIPKESKIQKYFPESFVFFKPKNIVSGDFYWFAQKRDLHILAVVDCTGHGVSGAFMTMISNNILNQIVHDYAIYQPNQILDKIPVLLNKVLRHAEDKIKDGMDISIISIKTFANLKNRENFEVSYAGAKNPLYYVQNQQLFEIKADKTVISSRESEEFHYTKHEIKLDKFQILEAENQKFNTQNPIFYLFTDGFADQFGGAEDRKFMTKRFRELLFSISQKPMAEQKQQLENTLNDWILQGNEKQTDDITVLGIRI